MPSLADFRDITTRDEPLARHCWMRTGGPAQFFVRPRSRDELTGVIRACRAEGIPWRVLGGGSNILVRDEGVRGAVLRLDHAEFAKIEVDGLRLRAGGGAALASVVTQSVRAGLAGMETLVGIPGTVGGALKGNAGGKAGEIGQVVETALLLSPGGELLTRTRDELAFGYRTSGIGDLVVLEAAFLLQSDRVETISQRLRTLWISKKASQPFGFQSAGCIFKNPRGMSAGLLIDKAGLKGTRVGGAEVSDRHANFIIAHPPATSADVLKLIDLVRSRVASEFGVDLELEIEIW